MPSPNWPRESTYTGSLNDSGKCEVHSLEYTITYQCVNRCRGCNHFTYIQPAHMISVEDFQRDVLKMASIAHCDKFSLIGGECLLHPDILKLIDISKASGIGDVVSLTTNGQILLDCFGDELWSRLDRIEMGIYAGKWDIVKLGALLDKIRNRNLPAFLGMVGDHPAELISLVQAFCSENPTQWKTCTNPSFHPTLSRDVANELEAQRRFSRCLYGHVCNTIDQGFIYRCPEACFVPALFPAQASFDGRRAVQELTASSFLEFVRAETHLSSCHLCRSLERYFPWQEVPEGTSPEQWVELARG